MTAAKESAKEIERDVEGTRSEIGATLDEIEHRLSPGQLVGQVFDYFGDTGRGGPGLGDIISRNPLPVMLIGIGVAWLVLSGATSRRPELQPRPATDFRSWLLPEVERNILMAVSRETLAEWLRDARAMEALAIETLEKQAQHLDHYPQLQAKLREHAAASRGQAARLDECMQRLGAARRAGDAHPEKLPGEEQIAALLGGGAVIKNGITGYAFEHFEIATYRTLIEAASQAGEPDVECVCRENLGEEEAMADWLARHIPDVTRQYLYHEAAQRSGVGRTSTTRPGAGTLR